MKLTHDQETASVLGLREAILIEYILSSKEDWCYLSLSEIKSILSYNSLDTVYKVINNLIIKNILLKRTDSTHICSYKIDQEKLKETLQATTKNVVDTTTKNTVTTTKNVVADDITTTKNVVVGEKVVVRPTITKNSSTTKNVVVQPIEIPSEIGDKNCHLSKKSRKNEISSTCNTDFCDPKNEENEAKKNDSNFNNLQSFSKFDAYISNKLDIVNYNNNNVSITELRSNEEIELIESSKNTNVGTLLEKEKTNDLENKKEDRTLLEKENDLGERKKRISRLRTSSNGPLGKDNLDTIGVPATIQPYLDIWTAKGFPLADSQTKTFKNSITYLRRLKKGTLFNNLSDFKRYYNTPMGVDSFAIAVENFSLSLTDSYKPINKETIRKYRNLEKFLLSLYSNGTTTRSLFIYYLEHEPESIHRVVEQSQELTTAIKEVYIERVLHGATVSFSDQEKENLIKSSNSLLNFIQNNKHLIKPIYIDNHKKIATLLVSSVLLDTYLKSVTTGVLCSQLTFSQRLPQWLAKNSFMENKKKRGFSIYDKLT